jgi:hypothetical protein
MNFPTILAKKSFSDIYWEMEAKFSPLSLMSLNPTKVPEFLRCSLKFIKRLNRVPEKRKLMPSARRQTFLYSTLSTVSLKTLHLKL